MKGRFTLFASCAAVLVVEMIVSAQRPGKAEPNSATIKRRGQGTPNLQGVWTSGLMIDVPFERPPELGNRAVLTDDELAVQIAAKQRQLESDRSERAAQDAVVGPPPHWAERGAPSRQASLIVDPPDGRLPPFTEDGARRAALWRATPDRAAGPEDLNPYDRCITRGVLGSMFPNIYNSAVQILQTPEHVALHHEMIHDTRIIPLIARPHLSGTVRQYMGDSRAHWEGRSLVVETTNLNGTTGSYGRNGNGNPTSQSARFVERFTLADANTLQYEVRIEDPQTWTQPWTVAFPLTRVPDYTLYEYACHEGNYAMGDILRGARAQESAAGR